MNKIYRYLLFSFLLSQAAFSQPSLRGMYINNFNTILGNSNKEDSLLQYALDSSYNYMALYDLHTLNLNNTNTANTLASFIKRARENFGVQYMGAVCETYSGFANRIVPYNNNRSDDNERFNVFNVEFEFWTTSSVNPGGYYCTQYLQQANCSCDTSGAFKYFIQQMHLIDSLAAVQQVLSEVYLGWFNQGQASQIQRNVDRVLLHAYRTNTSSLYSYSTTRLQFLASNNSPVDVAPIFSSEPAFMGSWLNSHAENEAYDKYKLDYDNDNSSWKQYINVLGYQWFDWGFMPKPAPGSSGNFNPTITASGSTTICSGNSVSLTATAGDSYMWSNGETTRSITLTSSGSFTCDVTLNSVTRTTPVSTVTVKNNPTATITAGALSAGEVTLTAITTAGSGTVSGYQWKLNNANIHGASGSTYHANATGDYSLLVTNSYNCDALSNIQSVSIPTSSCVLAAASGLSSTASTELSQILIWDQFQSGDSIVVRYKQQTGVTNFTYIRMANTGQTSVEITGLQPSTTYVWSVKTVCGSTQGTYSTESSFTTGGTNTGIHSIPQVKNPSGQSETTLESINVYPSPANQNVQIDFESTSSGNGELIVMDMSARTVVSRPIDFSEGTNNYLINTQTLGNGIYFISIKLESNMLMKQVIIQH